MDASRSEAATESKDPLQACSEGDRSRSSHDAEYAVGTPGCVRVGNKGYGSFDCVSLRFAKGNFAQDDKLMELA